MCMNGNSTPVGASALRIDRSRDRHRARGRNREWRTPGDTEIDSDTDGAFQADLSGLITKASGFAGG
jgi:hypothetical protein